MTDKKTFISTRNVKGSPKIPKLSLLVNSGSEIGQSLPSPETPPNSSHLTPEEKHARKAEFFGHTLPSGWMENRSLEASKSQLRSVVYYNTLKETRVVVLGSRGMLGSYCSEYFRRCGSQVIDITRDDFDFFERKNDIRDYLLSIICKGDLVINCVGYTNKQSMNTYEDREKAFFINSEFPVIVASVCSDNLAWMVHPSTDCVYDGSLDYPNKYTEDDDPNSTTIYGMSKAGGDKSLENFERVMIIRTSLIGEERKCDSQRGNGFLEWILKSDSQTIKGYINHYWTGITCLQFAKCVGCHLVKSANLRRWGGLYIISNPGNPIVKLQLAIMIANVYNVNVRIIQWKDENTVNRSMETSYHYGNKIPDIIDQIREMKDFDIFKRRSLQET